MTESPILDSLVHITKTTYSSAKFKFVRKNPGTGLRNPPRKMAAGGTYRLVMTKHRFFVYLRRGKETYIVCFFAKKLLKIMLIPSLGLTLCRCWWLWARSSCWPPSWCSSSPPSQSSRSTTTNYQQQNHQQQNLQLQNYQQQTYQQQN